MSALDRFNGNYKMVGECWEWQRGLQKKGGYGFLKVDGNRMLAHRFSYKTFVGELEDGKMVCHTCDNARCVNPKHLFLGTAKDNYDDMVAKGRNRNYSFQPGVIKPVKLTRELVEKIRTDKRKQADIAAEYKVSRQMISGIKTKKYWA